jgi:hypothetical protein
MGLASLALLLAMQSPAVSAELDRERVGVGDAVTLTVRALIAGTRPVRVMLPQFDGFTLIGRSDRRESGGPGGDAFVVELRLRALRVGLWRLGPVRLDIGDEVLSAPEVEVAVEAGSRSSAPVLGPRVLGLLDRARPPTPGDVAVTLLVSTDTALVGEQVDVVTAAWFPRELLARLRRAPTLSPPTIDGVYSAIQPSAAGVAAGRSVGGIWYDLYVAHQVIFPVSEGKVKIPGAGLAFSVPAGRQYFSEEKPYSLSSGERSLVVTPLPPGGPGPVAQGLALSYELRPEPARAGEPLRVDLVLSGTGNSALWPRPVVPWPDGSRGYPEDVEDSPRISGGLVGGTRRFRFVVIADSAGSLALPEVGYDYFDPSSGWRSAVARSVVLPVQPARPLDRQRPAPPLLDREPVSLTAIRGWVYWLVVALAVLPPFLLYGAYRWRQRPRSAPAATATAGERLQSLVRSLVEPERRRPGEMEAALREAGLDGGLSIDAARVYDELAMLRFAPRGMLSEGAVEADAARILGAWPRRAGRAGVITVFLAASLAAPAVSQSSADSLYHAERYAAAASLYRRDALVFPNSARRWYAVGAASWAAGQDASAAAAWLRALQLAPRSEDVRQAWGQVARFSGDLQRAGRVPPVTPAELAVVAVLLWALGWIVLGLRRRSSAIALGVLALGFTVGAAVLAGIQRRPLAVLARAVQLRDAPHGLAEEIGRAQVLAVVEVIEQRAAWRLIETPQHQRGWVPSTAIVEVRPLDSRP